MDDMTEIEESLRDVLRHVPAPEGFAGRVMARVAAEGTRPAQADAERRAGGTLLHMRSAAGWWTAAAAALLLTVGGGDALHIHQQHAAQRERAAEAEVDLALQLTSHALDQVERDVDRSPAGRWTHLGNEFLQ